MVELGESVILDPGVAQVELSEAEGWEITALDYTPPQTEMIAVSGVVTEGELSAGSKIGNRTNSATVEYVGEGVDEAARHADMRAKLSMLEQKAAKLAREGGVWRRVLKDGSTIDFYIRQFNQTGIPTDHKFVFGDVGEISLQALCAPYGVGVEALAGSFGFVGGPERVLTAEIADVDGTAPALARAVLTSPDEDVWWLRWGKESRHYSDAATALPYYAAVDLTPAPDSTVTTFNGEPSVLSPTVRAEWEEILATEIAGVGHMTHEGVVGVYAWVGLGGLPSADGPIEIRFEYARGDWAQATPLATITPVRTGNDDMLALVELGEARLTAGEGDHWRGRLVGRTPAGSASLHVVGLGFIPLAEGNATVDTIRQFDSPRNVLVRDDFPGNTSGALNGKPLAKGGNWSTGGDATDFTINTTDNVAQRTETNDSPDVGRYAVADAAAYGLVAVQVDVRATSMAGVKIGARARHVDGDTHLSAFLYGIGAGTFMGSSFTGIFSGVTAPFVPQAWYTIRLLVDHVGRYFIWWFPAGGFPGSPIFADHEAALGSGGDRETGLVGLYDENLSTTPSTRQFRNVIVFEPVVDAAIFAGRGLELSHDRARREVQEGGIWTPKTARGDYLTVPPSGLENRRTRFVFLPHLDQPSVMPARLPADLTADIYLTPRYYSVPDPT